MVREEKMPSVSEAVLDSSAVLAYLQSEPGAEIVEPILLGKSLVSAVNLAEIVSRLRDGGMPEPVIKEVLAELSLTIVPFDADSALATGLLIGLTKSLGLSLGDRACISLGITRHRPVLTTNRNWERLSLQVENRAIQQ